MEYEEALDYMIARHVPISLIDPYHTSAIKRIFNVPPPYQVRSEPEGEIY